MPRTHVLPAAQKIPHHFSRARPNVLRMAMYMMWKDATCFRHVLGCPWYRRKRYAGATTLHPSAALIHVPARCSTDLPWHSGVYSTLGIETQQFSSNVSKHPGYDYLFINNCVRKPSYKPMRYSNRFGLFFWSLCLIPTCIVCLAAHLM